MPDGIRRVIHKLLLLESTGREESTGRQIEPAGNSGRT